MVWNRTPLAFPERRMDRFASVMPIFAHSSLPVMFRAFSTSSKCTVMAMTPPYMMLSLSSLTALARRKYRHSRSSAAASSTGNMGKDTLRSPRRR